MFKGNSSAGLGVPEPLVDGGESGLVFVVEDWGRVLGTGFLGLSHDGMLALLGGGCNRVAPKMGNRYLFLQPWLPPIQATLVRGAFGVQAPARPASSCFLLLVLVAPISLQTPTPIPRFLMCSNLGQFFLGPVGDTDTCDNLSERGRNQLPLNPAVHGRAVNSY